MTPRALKFSGFCAAASAVTTFLLWFLPRHIHYPSDPAGIGLQDDPFLIGKLWVNFTHIFLALVGYGGTAWLLSRRSPALAFGGFVAFLIWGFTELLGVTIDIFAVNRTWRAGFATATAEVQQQLRTSIFAFQAVWDAMFFLLLIAFLIGTTCFGLAALRGTKLERVVGWLLLAATPLTVVITLSGYAGMPQLESAVQWSYPVLQPVSRAVLACWLWRTATISGRERPVSSAPFTS